MKIYYRGYVINGDDTQEPGCTVQGMRPERRTLAFEASPRSAMRWVDREVIKHRGSRPPAGSACGHSRHSIRLERRIRPTRLAMSN